MTALGKVMSTPTIYYKYPKLRCTYWCQLFQVLQNLTHFVKCIAHLDYITLRLWQNLLSSMWTTTLTPPTFCLFFFRCFSRLFTQILLSFVDIIESVAVLFAMPSWSMSTCRRCKPCANLQKINKIDYHINLYYILPNKNSTFSHK